MRGTGRTRGVRLRERAVRTVMSLGLLFALASCGSDPEQVAAGDQQAPKPAASSSQVPDESSGRPTEPLEPPDSSQPLDSYGSPTAAPPAGTGSLRGALVPGPQLAPLNAENAWRAASTTRSEPEPPAWVCQRVSMVSNGAVVAWTRSYVSAGTSTATQVVAGFADARSARLAFGSLKANAGDCATALEERGREAVQPPSPLTRLDVPQGRAGWSVVFSGPVRGDPDAAHIDAAVVVLVGDRLSVVSMSTIGQDYNYEPGQAPPELAGRVVAARLGG